METFFLHYPELTLDNAWETPEPLAVAIGVFDGVHLGHRAVIGQALAIAQRHDLIPTVFTFVGHPQGVLAPDHPVPLLNTWEEKQARLEKLGVQRVIGVHFTPLFARLSPHEFVENILKSQLQARAVCIGEGFGFGRRNAGKAQDLRRGGLDVTEVSPVCLDGAVISSSRIRKCLAEGAIKEANTLLGYSYTLTGVVVTGDQRGRLLGFPTANLKIPEQKLIPAYGVYAGWAYGEAERHPCVINIGQSPTFDPPQLKIEAHLLDFSGDLYGQSLSIEITERLRGEVAFAHIEELVEQIQQDVSWARGRLANH